MKLMITDSGYIVELIAKTGDIMLCRRLDDFAGGHNGRGTYGEKYVERCNGHCWNYREYHLKPIAFDNRKEVIE